MNSGYSSWVLCLLINSTKIIQSFFYKRIILCSKIFHLAQNIEILMNGLLKYNIYCFSRFGLNSTACLIIQLFNYKFILIFCRCVFSRTFFIQLLPPLSSLNCSLVKLLDSFSNSSIFSKDYLFSLQNLHTFTSCSIKNLLVITSYLITFI